MMGRTANVSLLPFWTYYLSPFALANLTLSNPVPLVRTRHASGVPPSGVRRTRQPAHAGSVRRTVVKSGVTYAGKPSAANGGNASPAISGCR